MNIPPLLIYGPTASGKSALALDLARIRPSVIINGDSLQVYKDLQILSARPPEEDTLHVPHKLYGILGAEQPCSAGEWHRLAVQEIEAAQAQGLRPIVVGGTGLYLKTLLSPLAPIPAISQEVLQEGQALQKSRGQEAFYELFKEQDPKTATSIKPQDRQRTLRGWGVLKETGKSLWEWQNQGSSEPDNPLSCGLIVLDPPRQLLYERAEQRFLQMIEQGALEEVQRVLSLYPWTMEETPIRGKAPLQIALGFRPLTRYLWHDIPFEGAIELSQIATRQYIKRQYTWMRHQLPTPLMKIDELYAKDIKESVLAKINGQAVP